jgi:hemerythrin-like metal-binding protein
LIIYTINHFSYEENMMQTVSYSKVGQHKKERNQLAQEVKNFKDEYDSGKMIISIEVRDFLKDWIVNYTQKIDNLYSAAVKENGLQ